MIKTLILINNGIHPGESDGIDATMLLYRDFATGKLKQPKNTVLITIPIYNIGGGPEPEQYHPRQPKRPQSLRFSR